MALRQIGSKLVIENLDSYLSGMARASDATEDFAKNLDALGRKKLSFDGGGAASLASSLNAGERSAGAFGTKLSALQLVGVGALTAIGGEAIRLAGTLTQLAAKTAINFVVGGVSDAGDAEQILADISAQSGATTEQMAALEAQLGALSLRSDLKIGFEGAGQAVEQLLNLGVKLPDILGGGLEQVVLLQNAIGGTTGQAGELFAQAVKQFKVEPAQFGDLTNQLIALRRAGLDATDILGLLAQGGGIAGNVIDFEEFAKLAAVVRPQFGSGSDAGTGIKTFLARAADPPKEMQEALDKFNIDLFDQATGQLKSIEDLAKELGSVLTGTITENVTTGGRTGAQNKELAELQRILAGKQDQLRNAEEGIKTFGSDESRAKKIQELNDEIANTQRLIGGLQGISGQTTQVQRKLSEKERLNLAEALGGADALRVILGLSGATAAQIAELDKLFDSTDGAAIAAERTATFNAKLETLGDVFEQVRRDTGTPLLAELTPALISATDLITKFAPLLTGLGTGLAEGIAPGIETLGRFAGALDALDGKTPILVNLGKAIAAAFNIEVPEDFLEFLDPSAALQGLDRTAAGLSGRGAALQTELEKQFGSGENAITTRIRLNPEFDVADKGLRPSSDRGQEISDAIDAPIEGRFSAVFGKLQVELQNGLDGIKLTKLKIGDFIDFNLGGTSTIGLGDSLSASIGADGKIAVTAGDLVFDLTDEITTVKSEFELLKGAFDTGGLFGGTVTDERGRETETQGIFDVLRTQIQGQLDTLTAPYGFTLATLRSDVENEFALLKSAFADGGIGGVLSTLATQIDGIDFVAVGARVRAGVAELRSSLTAGLFGSTTIDDRGREVETPGLIDVGALQADLARLAELDFSPVGELLGSINEGVNEFILGLTGVDVGATLDQTFGTITASIDRLLGIGSTVDERGRETPNEGLLTPLQGLLEGSPLDLAPVAAGVTAEFALVQDAFDQNGLAGVGATFADQFGSTVEQVKSALLGTTTLDAQGREVATPGLIEDLSGVDPSGLFADLKSKIQGQLDELNKDGAFVVSLTSVQSTIQGEIDLLQTAFDQGGLQGVFKTLTEQAKNVDTGAILGNVSTFIGDIFVLLSGLNDLGTENLSQIVTNISTFVQGLLASGTALLKGESAPSDGTNNLLAGADQFVASLIDRLTQTLQSADVESIAVGASEFVAAFFGKIRDTVAAAAAGEDSGETTSAIVGLITTIFGTLESTLRNPEFGNNIGQAAGDLVSSIFIALNSALTSQQAKAEKAPTTGFDAGLRVNPIVDFLINVQDGLAQSLLGFKFTDVRDQTSAKLDEAFNAVKDAITGINFGAIGTALLDGILGMLADVVSAIPGADALGVADSLTGLQSLGAQLARAQEELSGLKTEPGNADLAQTLLSRITETGPENFDFSSIETEAGRLGLAITGNNAALVGALQNIADGSTDNTERIQEVEARIADLNAQIAAVTPVTPTTPLFPTPDGKPLVEGPLNLSGPVTLSGPLATGVGGFLPTLDGQPLTPGANDPLVLSGPVTLAGPLTGGASAEPFLPTADGKPLSPDTVNIDAGRGANVVSTILTSSADTMTVASRGMSVSTPGMNAEINNATVSITSATLDIPTLTLNAGAVTLNTGAALPGTTTPGSPLPGATTPLDTVNNTTINNFNTTGTIPPSAELPGNAEVVTGAGQSENINLSVNNPELQIATRTSSITGATSNITSRSSAITTSSTKMDSKDTKIAAGGVTIESSLVDLQTETLTVTATSLSASVDSGSFSIGSAAFSISGLIINAGTVTLTGTINEDKPVDTTPPATGGTGGGAVQSPGRPFALGSTNYPGGRGIGGELGPELYVTPQGQIGILGANGIQPFSLPAGSRIYPADVTRSILSGSTEANTILQNATTPTTTSGSALTTNIGGIVRSPTTASVNADRVVQGQAIGSPFNPFARTQTDALTTIASEVKRKDSTALGRSGTPTNAGGITRSPTFASISADRVVQGQAIGSPFNPFARTQTDALTTIAGEVKRKDTTALGGPISLGSDDLLAGLKRLTSSTARLTNINDQTRSAFEKVAGESKTTDFSGNTKEDEQLITGGFGGGFSRLVSPEATTRAAGSGFSRLVTSPAGTFNSVDNRTIITKTHGDRNMNVTYHSLRSTEAIAADLRLAEALAG